MRTVHTLTDEQLDELARGWVHAVLQTDEEARRDGLDDEAFAEERDERFQRGRWRLFGEVVTAIEQVAVVKGLPMWEVERHLGSGLRKRLIVSARSLMPIQPTTACA